MYGILIIGMVVVFAIPHTGSLSLWGWTFPAYVFDTDYYIFLALALLTALWALKRTAVYDTVKPLQPSLYWLFAVGMTAATTLLALSFPVAFAFLGDGAIYIGEIFRIVTQPDHESNLMKATTWLGGWIITWLARMDELNNPSIPFQLAGVVSCIVFFCGMYWFLRKERFPVVLLWTFLILGSGGMLLFFGYIELYTPGFALAGLYFAACWATFRHGGSAILPGVILALAIASTASHAIFLPSYLVLLHWKYRGTGGRPGLKLSAFLLSLAPLAALIVLYGVFGLGDNNPYLIPLQAFDVVEEGVHFGTQSYTLFSSLHLIDVFNVLLLTGGIASVLLLVLIPGKRSIQWDAPVMLFAVTATAAGLVLALAGNTTFGMARDWDIMSGAGLAIVFIALTAITQLWGSKQLPLVRFLPLIAVLTIAPSYFWVKLNAEKTPSALRFTLLVKHYEAHVTPAYTFNALENLRKFYLAEEMTEPYIGTLLKMGATRYTTITTYRELIGILKNPKAASVAEAGSEAMLTEISKAASAPVPENDFRHLSESELRQFAVQALLGTKEAGYPATAERFVPELKNAFTHWPEFAMYEAYRYEATETQKRYEAIQSLDIAALSDIALIIRAGNISRNARQWIAAAALYERALEIDPHQYQKVYLTLAEVYYRGLFDKEKSIETLNRCIQNCIGSEAAERAKELLAKLQPQG